MTAQAKAIALADFVEETLTAVNRAVEIRSNNDKRRPPTITIGLIWDGGQTGDILWPDFDPRDLNWLKIGKPLNTQSVKELTDLLQRDYRRYGIQFAKALGQDFGRMMETAFELSSEQRNAFYDLTKVGSDSLKAVSEMLITTFNMNTDDVSLDLDISLPTTTKAASKLRPQIKLEFSTSYDFDKPVAKATLSFTWNL